MPFTSEHFFLAEQIPYLTSSLASSSSVLSLRVVVSGKGLTATELKRFN